MVDSVDQNNLLVSSITSRANQQSIILQVGDGYV